MEHYDSSVPSALRNSLREEFNFKLTSSGMYVDQKSLSGRKIICRYGRGCTHMHDTSHRDRFWHPPMPALTGDVFFKKGFTILEDLGFRLELGDRVGLR
jgi:hypothetical protein